jgi:hypothetical protein
MPMSRDGPESRVYEVCAFRIFFNRPSKPRAVTGFRKGTVERRLRGVLTAPVERLPRQ